MKLTILPNADEFWGRIATLLNGEQGDVCSSFATNGIKYYYAVFPIYGAEFSWIPAEFCEVV